MSLSEMTSARVATVPRPASVVARPALGRAGTFAALLLLLLGLVALQLTVGVVWIPLDQVFAALTGGEVDRVNFVRIVSDYRLPRTCTALAAGAALGVCGLLLQTLFRNPLADPWFLGLVQGSRLGVAVLVVLSGWAGTGSVLAGLGLLNATGLVIAAAAGAGALALVLASIAPRINPVTLLLSGVLIGQACMGAISLVLHFTDEAQVRLFDSWDDGAFTQVLGTRLTTLAALAGISAVAAFGRAKALNALLLGDNYARSLGVSVGRVRAQALGLAALLSGAVTAFCGPVLFLALLAPHAARAAFRTGDHRLLVPAVALTGAALASLADLLTHLPWSRHVLHLNAVNGLIGAPFVLWLLLARRSRRVMDA